MIVDTAVNDATRFALVEISVIILAYLVWMIKEARTLEMKNYWAYIVLVFCPSIAVSLPIFLFMRDRKLQSRERAISNGQAAYG